MTKPRACLRTCLAAIVAAAAVLSAAACAKDDAAPPRDDSTAKAARLQRLNDLLQRQVELADGKEFYLVLDPAASDLTLMLSGAELQRYPVIGLQVGTPRVSWFGRRVRGRGRTSSGRTANSTRRARSIGSWSRRRRRGRTPPSPSRRPSRRRRRRCTPCRRATRCDSTRGGPSRCARWTPTSRRADWRASARGGARSGTTWSRRSSAGTATRSGCASC